MTAGNPKQVGMLGVVAVGAIAFLGLRLIPARSAPNRESPNAEPARVVSSRSLSESLSRDPFSSPLLAVQLTTPTSPDPTDPKAPTHAPSQAMPISMRGDLRLERLPSPGIEENTPKDRGKKPDDPKKISVRVEATMRVEQTMAMISINGGEPRKYRMGDSIGSVGQVTAVDDRGVELTHAGNRTRINVGVEVSL